MQSMNQMMNMDNDPFGMAMMPFGGMGMGMGMPNMMQMMQHSNRAMPFQNAGNSYYSSSVISFNGNGSQPQVYQETRSNRIGPNGVREEQKTVRDSRSGLQQMTIGRHIGDRGHVIERKRYNHTGDEEENNEFINIEEEEAPQFNQEFNNMMASTSRRNPRGPMLAIAGPEHHRPSPPLICLSPSPSSSSSDSPKHKNKHRIKPTIVHKKDKKPKKMSKPKE